MIVWDPDFIDPLMREAFDRWVEHVQRCAAEEEREACARVAKDVADTWGNRIKQCKPGSLDSHRCAAFAVAGNDTAAAIRARGGESVQGEEQSVAFHSGCLLGFLVGALCMALLLSQLAGIVAFFRE